MILLFAAIPMLAAQVRRFICAKAVSSHRESKNHHPTPDIGDDVDDVFAVGPRAPAVRRWKFSASRPPGATTRLRAHLVDRLLAENRQSKYYSR